jgi:hypothetical protein
MTVGLAARSLRDIARAHFLTGTDVDLKNRLDGATPLHVAVKLENEAARQGVIDMLLDAGADPRFVPLAHLLSVFVSYGALRMIRIKDKHGCQVAEYLNVDESETDKEILKAINLAIAEFVIGGVGSTDIADDDDDEPGSGSGSESD